MSMNLELVVVVKREKCTVYGRIQFVKEGSHFV